MLIRSSLQITVTPLEDGAAVHFRKDTALVASLRQRFPRARWGATTRSWHVHGKLAAHRAQLWANEQAAYLMQLEQDARDREFDAPTSDCQLVAHSRRPTWSAICGQPSASACRPPPDGDVERIKAMIEASPLAGHGFWESLPAGWHTGLGDDTHAGFTTWHPARAGKLAIHWRWQALYGGDGWQRDGWLPSDIPPAFWPWANPGAPSIWRREGFETLPSAAITRQFKRP